MCECCFPEKSSELDDTERAEPKVVEKQEAFSCCSPRLSFHRSAQQEERGKKGVEESKSVVVE